jgi:phage terminase large subunit-like protein
MPAAKRKAKATVVRPESLPEALVAAEVTLTEVLSYSERAHRYARAIVAKKIPSCRYTQLACKRHLDDLEKSKDPAYPYQFDAAHGNDICKFAEALPHVKGEWAKKGSNIKLEDWQCFVLAVPFGWLRRADGTRRFREIYDEISRKNGKSVLGAVIGNYMFLLDGEHGAEVYSGATTEKQAWEVFGPARLMLDKSPKLVAAFGVEVNARHLVMPADNSRFTPLIGNPGDGSSPSCAIIDEFHEHQTSNQYDTMVTGTAARRQPMIAIITTAGTSLSGPCYDKHIEVRKMLEGTVQNDELFAIIYSIDEDDDWTDPEVLRKANPNYGVSASSEFLITQQRLAVTNVSQQNRFKTKHLDVWCSAKSAWMNLEEWNLCADPTLRLEQFGKDRCWFILDLASRNDICAFMLLFRRIINGQAHYYVFGRYYLPESALEEKGPNQTAYQLWKNDGTLTVTDGTEIDFDFIREEVKGMASKFQVEEVVYDPWRAVHLAQQLMKDGANCVEYRQTVQTMSLPMKELMAAVKAKRLHHDGSRILSWMMSNVVAKEDAKENIYPRKEKHEMKIDGPVAIIMGLGRAMVTGSDISGFSAWLKSEPVTA